MTNITKAIKGASLKIWDEKIPHNPHWIKHGLLDPGRANEKYRYTLYVHVMKNEEKYAIWDNNGGAHLTPRKTQKPKIIAYRESYMLKWGKSEKGIISRRRDDFQKHYHFRDDDRHQYHINLTLPHTKSKRVGSAGTLLHLIIDFKSKHPQLPDDELKSIIRKAEKELEKSIESAFPITPPGGFISNSTFVSKIYNERINIPIASVRNERNFIAKVTKVFEAFEGTL